ncbi:MAG TPA: ROK family transcriptional regulator [Candidatus Limnocylindrales bacterium]
MNLSAIVRGLHEHGPLSRSELVSETGLTRSAIRGLVGQLVDSGLAVEDRAVRLGTPGRPSPLVRLDGAATTALAFDIAVDSLAAAIVGLGGAVLDQARIDRPRGHSSVDDIAADLAQLAAGLGDTRFPAPTLIGIGVAVAGVVRRSDGLVAMAPNLGWTDVPLGTRLSAALGVAVPVAVGNEADLGVLAEHRRGAAIGVDDVLYVSGEVGVGGGLIVGGNPFSGASGYGGEIGHMPVNPAGSSCRCGSTGCWETEIGEEALLARSGRPRDAGRAGVAEIVREAEAGGVTALAALDDVGAWLGVGLAGLVNVLNPRLIVLGGQFCQLFPFVRAALETELGRRALRAPRALVQVVPASLGVDAPLLGAAELAFEPILADPAAWFGPRSAPHGWQPHEPSRRIPPCHVVRRHRTSPTRKGNANDVALRRHQAVDGTTTVV